MTRGEFASRVTTALGAKVTLHTRRAWAAQMQTEGGGARNNPFNTTQRMVGSTDYNSAGVQNYVSPEQGIAATVRTLHYAGHGYELIIRRLRRNATATDIIRAIGYSDWGTDLELALAVLDDIKHNRYPNTLTHLEAREIAS
jgi:hypothetical protein